MIGIITFHGSHNYGSVLQAYATQKILRDLGYQSEIINFRMKSQKEYYKLYPIQYGIRTIIGDIMLLPNHNDRKICFSKFESFMKKYYVLSGPELETYDDLKTVSSKYDIYLTGSDQIWSNRIPELVGSELDYTGVYFLDFVEDSKKRIAFASSVGEADEKDLSNKVKFLKKFSHISTRETYGVDLLSKLTGQFISKVLDPTLMVSKEEWLSIATKEPIVSGKYIFLYTLRGVRKGMAWGKYLSELGKKLNMKVVCISPFFPVLVPGVENIYDAGPEDFINIISNASVVFTDSFHGTAFSINLNKPFFSLTPSKEKDVRKREIIDTFGLGDRGISSYAQIAEIQNWELDYSKRIANQKLKKIRKECLSYLQMAIET